jgi:hypothetical protein
MLSVRSIRPLREFIIASVGLPIGIGVVGGKGNWGKSESERVSSKQSSLWLHNPYVRRRKRCVHKYLRVEGWSMCVDFHHCKIRRKLRHGIRAANKTV